MSWLDLFTGYLYVLKSIAIVIAVVIFISGLDDLFIDLFYWGRRAWRALSVYSRHEQMNHKALLGVDGVLLCQGIGFLQVPVAALGGGRGRHGARL